MFDFNLTGKKHKAPAKGKSAEEVANEEISETLKGFKQRGKDEIDAKTKNTSSEYWCAIYFADEEQRNEFLEKINALTLLEDQYINGVKLAKRMGIELTEKKLKKPKAFKMPKGIGDLIGF